jgi:hypothetical protein
MLNIKARLIALSLMANLGAADTAGLGVGEIDVIFPRNETFELMPLMPVVFAIQNPVVIDRLYPTLSYGLWSADTPLYNQTNWTNLAVEKLPDTESSVLFLLDGIANTLNTETGNRIDVNYSHRSLGLYYGVGHVPISLGSLFQKNCTKRGG